MLPLVPEDGSANRQGSKQVLSAQQPCTHTHTRTVNKRINSADGKLFVRQVVHHYHFKLL